MCYNLLWTYEGPFEIIENMGETTYTLNLPEHMATLPSMFHVSHLYMCKLNEEDARITRPCQLEPTIDFKMHWIKEWFDTTKT